MKKTTSDLKKTTNEKKKATRSTRKTTTKKRVATKKQTSTSNSVTGNTVTIHGLNDGIAQLRVQASDTSSTFGGHLNFNAVSTHTHANKPILDAIAEAPATQTALNAHVTATNNPHSVVATQVFSDYATHAGQYPKVKSDGSGFEWGAGGGGGGTYTAGEGISISSSNVISVIAAATTDIDEALA